MRTRILRRHSPNDSFIADSQVSSFPISTLEVCPARRGKSVQGPIQSKLTGILRLIKDTYASRLKLPSALRVRGLWLYLKRYISVGRNVSVGSNFHIGVASWISSPNKLAIGNDVYVGKFCSIEGNGAIGAGTLIANRVGVGGAVRPDLRASSSLQDAAARIDIGRDVWIGFGCTIASGVSIGRGAVVAAGSVVGTNVQPYDIVGGNPAKTVGRRFTDDQIAAHEAATADV